MTIIVHHAGCPDGVSSAAWLGRHLAGPVEHVYGSYDRQPTPEEYANLYDDQIVFFVDFCWPAGVMEIIKGVASRVLVIDHHQTSLPILRAAGYNIMGAEIFEPEAVLNFSGADAIHDQRRSGIGLTVEFVKLFWPDTKAPDWFKHIEDRDLWKFTFGEDTQQVMAALTSYPYTVEAWDRLISEQTFESLVGDGEAINRYRDQLIGACVDHAWQETVAGYEDIWATDAPYTIASDVAGILAERDPWRFAAYFVRSEGQVKVGLRSSQDRGMNVADIAEQYGGGGHPHAAGYTERYARDG